MVNYSIYSPTCVPAWCGYLKLLNTCFNVNHCCLKSFPLFIYTHRLLNNNSIAMATPHPSEKQLKHTLRNLKVSVIKPQPFGNSYIQNFIIRLTHANVWESMGKLCSCMQFITAKSYVLNQNWNQSDPDLYPETQRNFLAMGPIPNCKSYLYQFCSSVSVLQKQP